MVSPSAPGPLHPPKKRSVARHEAVIIAVYSAMKNIANFIAEYSVWKPPTSSVSASGRSNGTRFVSAITEMKKTMKPRNCGSTNHCIPYQPDCAATISRMSSVPAWMSSPTTESVSASS